MKKILGIAVTLLLLLAVGPWAMGHVAKRRVDRGVDVMVEAAPYLHVVERQWTSGWFRSEQRVTFEVRMPGIDAALAMAAAMNGLGAPPATSRGPLRFSVHNQVLHGPLPGFTSIGVARVNSRLEISESLRAKAIALFGTDEPVRIRTRVGFFGGATTTLSGEGRRLDLASLGSPQGSGTLAWDDFSLSVSVSKGASGFDVDGEQPRIEITGARGGAGLRMEGLSVEGEGERIVGDLYDTDVVFSMKKLRLTGASDDKNVEIADLRYAVDTSREGEFLDYAVQMGSGAVTHSGIKAAGIELAGVHYDFSMRHLHLDTMQQLMTALKEAYAAPVDAETPDPQAIFEPFRKHGMALLRHDPRLEIDRLGVVTAEGEGVLRGVVSLEGVTDADIDAGLLALVRRVIVDLRFEAPRAMLEKLPNGAQMVAAGLQSGHVVEEGDKITSRFEFRSGAFTINGKPQNLPVPGLTAPSRGPGFEAEPAPEAAPAAEPAPAAFAAEA